MKGKLAATETGACRLEGHFQATGKIMVTTGSGRRELRCPIVGTSSGQNRTARDFLPMTHRTAACKMPATAHEIDLALIRELGVEYVSALMSGDMGRWISLWSPRGVAMQSAGLRLTGIEQIEAALQPELDLFDTEMTILPESIHIRGDFAHSYGSYKHAMTPKEGGEVISVTGMFLTILEKQANGSWKIVITCCNTSQRPYSFS